MNEDEMIRKMGLGRWNSLVDAKYGDRKQADWVGTEFYRQEHLVDVDLARGSWQIGVLLTPDEAEAFGLRLVAAAGIVRARQETKEADNGNE